MSNKTQLQTNNIALDALITRVNAAKDIAASLPEAGEGSGEATSNTPAVCPLFISGVYTPTSITYTVLDSVGMLETITNSSITRIEELPVVCGTIVFIELTLPITNLLNLDNINIIFQHENKLAFSIQKGVSEASMIILAIPD